MTNVYGLREIETGRIMRISSPNRVTWQGHFLTMHRAHPIWAVDSLADLIMTYCVNPSADESSHAHPSWNGMDFHKMQPVKFVTETEYDMEGGDPVAITHRIKPFSVGDVFDLRPTKYHGGDLKSIHYGIAQQLFNKYDMDRIEHLSVSIIPYKGEYPNLRGAVVVTHDIGPASIVGFIDLPDDWALNAEQTELFKAMKEDGYKFLLVLSDSTTLEEWLDYDQYDPDHKLTKRISSVAGFVGEPS